MSERPVGSSDGEVGRGADSMRALLERPLGASELARQTAEVARPLKQDESDRVSVLLVECGGERFGLPGSLVRRVTAPVPIHRIPHRSNAVLRGLCNLGGHLSLVASLEALLDLPAATPQGAERRMLLVGDGAEQWVIEVDRVLGVARIETSRLVDPPSTVRAAKDHLTERLILPTDGSSEGRVALLSSERLLAGLRRSLG